MSTEAPASPIALRRDEGEAVWFLGNLATIKAAGACGGLPSDAVDFYASGSGLQYLGNGDWRYSWKTPASPGAVAGGVEARVAACFRPWPARRNELRPPLS